MQSNHWCIQRMTGFTIKHPFIVLDPACPPGRHPTRNCGCQVFRTMAEAEKYRDQQQSVQP